MEEKPKIIEGKLFVDDRGYLSFVNDFNFQNVKRFYMVENHEKGFIRAWHGHKKEEKYVFVVQGSAMVCLYPVDEFEKIQNDILFDRHICHSEDLLIKNVLSSRKPQILYIPAGYANGFKTLEENTKIIFFSTSTLEESKGDDYRFDYCIIDPWQSEYR